MENKFLFLKQSIISLTLDVQELKDTLHEINMTRHQSGSTSISNEIPNIDVELYWSDKTKDHKSSNHSSGIQILSSAITNPPLTIGSLSQNIPSIHPEWSQYQQRLHCAKLQARKHDSILETTINSINYSCVDDSSAASSRNSHRIH